MTDASTLSKRTAELAAGVIPAADQARSSYGRVA